MCSEAHATQEIDHPELRLRPWAGCLTTGVFRTPGGRHEVVAFLITVTSAKEVGELQALSVCWSRMGGFEDEVWQGVLADPHTYGLCNRSGKGLNMMEIIQFRWNLGCLSEETFSPGQSSLGTVPLNVNE